LKFLRITFQEDLASAYKQISQSSAMMELINKEESQDMHKLIKWMKKNTKGKVHPHQGKHVVGIGKQESEIQKLQRLNGC
jgi:hypothetical protein